MRVALFVESSEWPDTRRGSALEQTWNDGLAAALGLVRFDPVVPMGGKDALTAMHPPEEVPPMSGAGEPFDANKNGWGEYLLRGLLADERGRDDVLTHPIAARLAEWLPSAP